MKGGASRGRLPARPPLYGSGQALAPEPRTGLGLAVTIGLARVSGR